MTHDITTAATTTATASVSNHLTAFTRRAASALAPSTGVQVLLALLLVGLLASSPAAAQQSGTSSLCNSQALADFFGGLFKATTLLGISGALVVYKWQTLMEVISFNQQQRKAIKQKKSDVMRGVAVLVLIGPAYTTIGSMMGLPGASCVFAI